MVPLRRNKAPPRRTRAAAPAWRPGGRPVLESAITAALKIRADDGRRSSSAWNPPGGQAWQLVDGDPQAMALANRTHGAIQAELGSLIIEH